MAKKHPDHVHCVRCGYRGINAEHDCNEVRAATAAVIAQAARRDEAKRIANEPAAPHREAPRLIGNASAIAASLFLFGTEHSRTSGRRIEYEAADLTGTIIITQRCATCREQLEQRAAFDLDNALVGLELFARARRAYLLHRCQPVTSALNGFTYEELEQLRTELERDATKMLERAAEIQKIEAARIITGEESKR